MSGCLCRTNVKRTRARRGRRVFRSLSAAAAIALILLFTPVSAMPDQLCGPRSLLHVCQELGINATLDELAALSKCSAASGTSLLDLKRATEAKGLAAAAMKIGAADLAKPGTLSVACLAVDHFVAVKGCGDHLQVTDSPLPTTQMKAEDFTALYSGFALLVARDPAAFPKPRDEGPDLRLATYRCDLGCMYAGDCKVQTVKCRNSGSMGATISKVEPSCSCVSIVDRPYSLAPGAEADLKFLLNSSGERGGVAYVLMVSSNDPIVPVLRLEVIAYVRSRALPCAPRRVSFGQTRPQYAIQEVYIPSTEQEPVLVKKVECEPSYLKAYMTVSSDPALPGTMVTVSLDPDTPVGQINGKLRIETDHPFQPIAELPVTATIKGNVELDRDAFFLGFVKEGKGAAAEVTISTVSKDPLKISKIESTLGCVDVKVEAKAEGREYFLKATLKPDAPPGNVKGEVIIHTNEAGPEVRIPVYAFIEKE